MWDVNLIDGSPVLSAISLKPRFDAVIKIEELLEGGGTIEAELNRELTKQELTAIRQFSNWHNIRTCDDAPFPINVMVQYSAIYESIAIARELEKILRILGFSKILFHLNPRKRDREEFFTLLDTPAGAN